MEVGYNLPHNEPNLLLQFQLAYFDSSNIFGIKSIYFEN